MSGAEFAGAAGSGTAGAAERAAALERRYRRLLAWYPRDHRAEHGDEMVGVLMTAASEGQRRPGRKESTDLVAGAIRIRVHRAAGAFRDPRWRDALAVVSVLAPLLLLALSVERAPIWHLPVYFQRESPFGGQYALPFSDSPVRWALWPPVRLPLLAAWLAVTGLVLARRRRAAGVAAAIAMTGQVLIVAVEAQAGANWWAAGDPYAPVRIFLGALALVAILASDGPRRGLEILGRGRSALVIVGLLGWASAHSTLIGFARQFVNPGHVLNPGLGDAALAFHTYTAPAALAVLVAVAVLYRRDPVGRRVLVLLAAAASPHAALYLAGLLVAPGPSMGPHVLLWAVYLTLAIAVVALAVTARRVRSTAGLSTVGSSA